VLVEREVWVSGVKQSTRFNGITSYGDIVRTHEDLFCTTTDTAWPAANRAIWMRARGYGVISNLCVTVGAQNTGNLQTAVYNTGATSGRGGKPSTLLVSSTAAAYAANALAVMPLSASIEIIPWFHWIAIWCSTTTVSLGATNALSTSISSGMMANQNSLSSGLPSTAAATALGSVVAPIVVGS
jgi:hypothetical protein